MKTYPGIIVLLELTLLAACGGNTSPQVLIATATPSPTVAPTVDVNAVDTEPASSVFATETAAAPDSLIDQYELSANSSRNIGFTLKPNSAWPRGTFRVDIYGNGALAKSLTFQVQSGAAYQTP